MVKALPGIARDLPGAARAVTSTVKSVVPAVKTLVSELPALVKSGTTSFVEGVTGIVQNPAGFINALKTGLQNPVGTRGGIFGTAPATPGAAGAVTAETAGVDAAAVNAVGGTQNCVACAIAGDSTLAGNPASALDLFPGRPIPGGNQLVEQYAGAPWRPASGPGAIETEMLAAGDGARGIVYGTDGVNAHVWNAVVQRGQVNFVDFQGIGPSGSTAFEQWSEFAFVRTN